MIYFASDRAGFHLKKEIKKFFETHNIQFEDLGPFEYDEKDDYPDFIIPVAEKVGEGGDKNQAIIFGGSGQGEAIAAGKVKGVRATVFYGGPGKIITLSKEHNNANILSIGARFVNPVQAKHAIELWLKTPFAREKRHVRRTRKIEKYENRS